MIRPRHAFLALGFGLVLASHAAASLQTAGNVASRTVTSGTATLKAQTLSWDAYNRLVGVSVAPNSSEDLGGYNWTTVYDGFGRRVQTTWQPTTTSGGNSGSASTITYYYDPLVQYLELGQMVLNPNNSSTPDRTWKVYGPDKSGTYGGAQGEGGLDNEVDEAGGFGNAPFNNYFGDAVGEVFVSNINSGSYYTETYGYGSIYGGYGYVPGSTGYEMTPEWRGHYVDYTGFIYQGARYYEYQSGRFLSADPLGQAGSMDLYSYCNGDPVNELDPDGCLGKGALEGVGLSDGSTDAPSNYTPQPGSEGAYQERLDDIMAGGGVAMDQAEQEIAAQDYISNSPEAQQAILDLIPGVSLAEGITGTNFVTGQALSGEQRYLAVNLGAIGLAGGLSGAAENFAADEAVDTSLGTALDQNVQLTQYQLDLEGDAAAAEGTSTTVQQQPVQQAQAQNLTRMGVARNNPADWKATMALWDSLGYGSILSEANRMAINAGLTPEVDQAWIDAFPEHAPYAGQLITQHHIFGLSLTQPVPYSLHLKAHMPGGFRYNSGGVPDAF